MVIKNSKRKPIAEQSKGSTNGHQNEHTPRHQPNWPPLQPLAPADHLELVSLLPDQIITVSQLWTSTLCRNYISFLATLPLATTPGKPKKGDAVRVNDRYQIDDPAFAELLWSSTGLRQLVERSIIDGNDELDDEGKRKLWGGQVIGLNSNIRVYRYSKGQFFDQHCAWTLPSWTIIA